MNNHINDILSVGYVNGIAVVISVSDIETGLRVFSLLLATAYTTYKFYKAIKTK